MFTSPGSRSSYNRLQASMRRMTAAARPADGTSRVSLQRSAGLPGSLFFRNAGNSGSTSIGNLDFGLFDWKGGNNALIYGRSGQDPESNWASNSNYWINFVNDPYGGSFSVNANGSIACSGNLSSAGAFMGVACVGSPYLAGGWLTAPRTGGVALGATQGAFDCFWFSDGAGIWASSNAANAQSIRLYNTTDGSANVANVNYERAVFDWKDTTNVLTIGTEKGGTGSTRNLQFKIAGTLKLDYGVTNAGNWTFAAPPVLPGYTVAGLPTGVLGAKAYVTDGAASQAWGATVTGGGSTKYQVWYNGSAWTITGK